MKEKNFHIFYEEEVIIFWTQHLFVRSKTANTKGVTYVTKKEEVFFI